MSKSERRKLLRRANQIAKPYGIRVKLFPDHIRSVGVQGDGRTYRPVVYLVGPFLDHTRIAELSTKLTNELPINRVALQIATIQ